MNPQRELGSFRLALLFLASSCGFKGPPVAASEVEASPAVRGVRDPVLAAILADHWEGLVESDPLYATSLGDHRFDDRLPDESEAGNAARREFRDRLRRRLKRVDASMLSPSDALNRDLLAWKLDADAGRDVCAFETWALSATNHPVATLLYLPELHPPDSRADAEALRARLTAAPAWIDAQIANLQRGKAEGRVAPRESLVRLVAMLDRELAKPPLESPMRPDLSALVARDSSVGAVQADLDALVAGPVRAAVQRFRDFVDVELVPAGRPDDRSGVSFLPSGDACYAAAIRYHTSLDVDAETLHRTGLDELAQIHAEMRVLGQSSLGTSEIPVIFERLRSDLALRFDGREAIVDAATASLARANAAVPNWFGRLPRTPCEVREIPAYEAPFTHVAYYRQPFGDGSKPGEYFVNTYAPDTRLRHEAQVLAFHESVPGHHLQIALAQELAELPMFRRHFEPTVYIEGWALYSERLADEMGLYNGDLDRLGMLAFDAWRASRLVVDTGLHAKGWSRAEAERFMLDNTPLAENNVRNEVDRYIHWPGQALGYKVGQLEIRRLRREAETALGERFDIRAFHDVVLGQGAVTLPVLQRAVERWVAEVNSTRSEISR